MWENVEDIYLISMTRGKYIYLISMIRGKYIYLISMIYGLYIYLVSMIDIAAAARAALPLGRRRALC